MKEMNSIERFGDRLIEIATLAGCFPVLSIPVLVLRYSEKRFVTSGDVQSTESL